MTTRQDKIRHGSRQTAPLELCSPPPRAMGQQGLQAFVWELQTCKLSPTPEGIHSGYTTAMLQNHKQTIRGVRCIGNAQASVVRSPRMRRRRTRITRSRHRGGSQNKPFAGPGKRAPPAPPAPPAASPAPWSAGGTSVLVEELEASRNNVSAVADVPAVAAALAVPAVPCCHHSMMSARPPVSCDKMG